MKGKPMEIENQTECLKTLEFVKEQKHRNT